MTKEEGKVKAPRISQDNAIVWGAGLAGGLSIAWGLTAQYILHYNFLASWWPIILVVMLSVSFGAAATFKSDTGRQFMYIVLIVLYLLASSIGLRLLVLVGDVIWRIFIAIRDIFVAIKDALLAFNQTLQTIAANQPTITLPAFAGMVLAAELVLAAVFIGGSVFVFVTSRKYPMKVKQVLLVSWAIYALVRGWNTMLPVFLLGYLVSMYGKDILSFVFGVASMLSVDKAEKAGQKKLVQFITAVTIVMTVLVTSIIGGWFVGIVTVIATNVIPTIMFACAGIAVAQVKK